MKWLKHYSNANTSNALTEIEAEYGMAGYGRYWRLLEEMCKKFDGENDELFVFRTVTLRGLLGFHRTQDLIKFLSSLNQVGIMSHFSKDHVIEIRSDILLRLQGRDYKKARSKRAKPAPKNKIKNKNKNIDQKRDTFDFERVYNAYPKKVGRKKGEQRFKSQITTKEKYSLLLKAVENFSRLMEDEGRERKYIKGFDVFMNCWEDFLEIETNEKTEIDFEAFFNDEKNMEVSE